jgi:hypothetical protein
MRKKVGAGTLRRKSFVKDYVRGSSIAAKGKGGHSIRKFVNTRCFFNQLACGPYARHHKKGSWIKGTITAADLAFENAVEFSCFRTNE